MLVTVAVVLGWIGAAAGAGGVVLRSADTRRQVLVVAASGSYLLTLTGIVGLVLQVAARSWPGVVVGAAVVAIGVWPYLPYFSARSGPDGATTVRVLTQNLLLGRADASHLVRQVASERVDIVFVQELTPEAEEQLGAAGLDAALPHRWSRPDHSAYGAGIWSRFPLDDRREYPHFFTATLSAVVTLPDGRAINTVCVHPPAPWPREPGPWLTDLAAVPALIDHLPELPVVMAGDFNATLDHAPFRRLLGHGFRDGAEQAGRGVVRTWPANRRVPPLLGLDHVVTRGLSVTRLLPVASPGSDHLGLLATVALPH